MTITALQPLNALVFSVDLSHDPDMYGLDPVNLYYTRADSEGRVENFTKNTHTYTGKTDIQVALDQLLIAFPRCTTVYVYVTWYGDDLRCDYINIQPKVLPNQPIVLPYPWQVEDISAADAPTVSLGLEGLPAFGGTPSDSSIARLCAEIKGRGLNVALVPMIKLDIPNGNVLPDPITGNPGQTAYPTSENLIPSGYNSANPGANVDTQINKFFGTSTLSEVIATYINYTELDVVYVGPQEWSYSRFIYHYLQLAAEINAHFNSPITDFFIGYNLEGLTCAKDASGNYQFVNLLANVAQNAKLLLGHNVKISYAASNSQWNGSYNLANQTQIVYPLDTLWANPNIDYIGVLWKQPLSDWRTNGQNTDQLIYNILNKDYYQTYIEGGENYDWYYASNTDRDAQLRTLISGSSNIAAWAFRSKDIRNWWNNYHYNYINNVASLSPWIPQSKSIRLLGVGFPAVNNGQLQPGLRPDHNISSNLPYYSDGTQDLINPPLLLQAFFSYWESAVNNQFNPLNALMIDYFNSSVREWDVVPFPHYQTLQTLYPNTDQSLLGFGLNKNTITPPQTDYYKYVDYTALFPEDMYLSEFWGPLIDAIDRHMNPTINAPLAALERLRDPDYVDIIQQVNNVDMLGFYVPTIGFTAAEYYRLMKYYGKFVLSKASSTSFVSFMSFIKNAAFTFAPLYINAPDKNNLTIDSLTETPTGNLIEDGGTWIPTVYYSIEYDPEVLPDLNVQLFQQLFSTLAPYYLVLRSLTAVVNITPATLYMIGLPVFVQDEMSFSVATV